MYTFQETITSLGDLRRLSCPWMEAGETRLSASKGLSTALKFSRTRERLTKIHDQWRTLATTWWTLNQVFFPLLGDFFNFWAVVKGIYFAAKAPKSKIMHRNEWKLNSSNLRKKRWYFRTCETISLTRYVLRQKQNKTETLSMCMN